MILFKEVNMTPNEFVAYCLTDLVGKEIAQQMAARHIRSYLLEKGNNEMTLEDISSPEFAGWLKQRLWHISSVNPEGVEAMLEKLGRVV